MTEPESTPPQPPRVTARVGSRARRRALAGIGGTVLIAAIAYTAYWALVLRHFETTDNAYVQGNVVQITPQIAGTAVAIGADETDRVKAGTPLLRLDPADAEVALQQAEAQLGATVREVRSMFAGKETLSAQIAVREAEVARTQTEFARAEADAARRAPLVASGEG